MKRQQSNFKKEITAGLTGGMLWGLLALLTNAITGFFPFEHNWFFNLVVFSTGGAVFGIVVVSFMVVMKKYLPFKSPLSCLIFISAFLWVILSFGGFMLSGFNPERYHYVTAQTLQGFVLSIVMGCIIGLLWNKAVESA